MRVRVYLFFVVVFRSFFPGVVVLNQYLKNIGKGIFKRKLKFLVAYYLTKRLEGKEAIPCPFIHQNSLLKILK